MAQRNPMNQRYQGDGPGGQTRRSASSAKPASDAAASVQVKGKPSSSAEKKAAEQAQKERMRKKAAERQRKAARAEQAKRTTEAKAKLARGEITAAEAEAESQQIPEAKPKKKGLFAIEGTREAVLAENPVYRKWRKRYWVCFAIGLVFGVGAFLVFSVKDSPLYLQLAFIIPAYVMVTAGLLIQMVKIRPIIRASEQNMKGKKTPKQLKHQKAAQQQAEQVARARQAEKDARKWGRKADGPAEASSPPADTTTPTSTTSPGSSDDNSGQITQEALPANEGQGPSGQAG